MVVKTIDEQVQLVRVFRLLAFDIPLQITERKLERASQRKSCAEYQAKLDRYTKEHAKFITTLQEETSNGREMVCAKYHITVKSLAAIVDDLGNCSSLSALGKSHLEELIWELNDNLDGMLSFDEFEKSYIRSRLDHTGLEPSEMFFLTGFLMFDKERTGRIVLDDAMKIFYLKYGDAMENEMEIHFGSKLDEGAQFITFAEFYDAIVKRAGELIDQHAAISKANKSCKRM
uniref:EF-hand domain-containing protein n=1 Tax=Globisporangium ultimum (strain ATCC 200006 / CBS 805.95 / DAOM BR144) TaxID=431595 RepID=K3W7I7_GLOUD